MRWCRVGLAPWMCPAAAGGCAVRRPLELGFRRKARAAPLRVRRSFSLAHIDGPRQRQRDQIEHPAPVPRLALPFPEERMAQAFSVNPGPVVGPPPSLGGVAAR